MSIYAFLVLYIAEGDCVFVWKKKKRQFSRERCLVVRAAENWRLLLTLVVAVSCVSNIGLSLKGGCCFGFEIRRWSSSITVCLKFFLLSSVDIVCHVNSVLLSKFPVPVSELSISSQAI